MSRLGRVFTPPSGQCVLGLCVRGKMRYLLLMLLMLLMLLLLRLLRLLRLLLLSLPLR